MREAAATWMEPGLKVDRSAIEAFTFLAYEAVGQIVEMALLARDEWIVCISAPYESNTVCQIYSSASYWA